MARRAEIDRIDDELVALLKRRMAAVADIQALKRTYGLAEKDADRERAICERLVGKVPPAQRDLVYGIYERIFNQARGVIETIARGVCVRDGKVLLCKAKGGATTYLPGGHIEFGETGREALVREIKEELGVDATAGDFLGVEENSFLQHGQPHCEINLIYRLELAANASVALEQWIEFVWCDLADLSKANLLPKAMERYVHN